MESVPSIYLREGVNSHFAGRFDAHSARKMLWYGHTIVRLLASYRALAYRALYDFPKAVKEHR